jgi:acetyl esterase/lipase
MPRVQAQASRGRRHWLLAAAGSLLLPGCSALGALDAVVPRGTYRGREGIAYGPLPRQQLDAYLPLQADGTTPLVVFFYGGNWTRGERADYRFVGEALASQRHRHPGGRLPPQPAGALGRPAARFARRRRWPGRWRTPLAEGGDPRRVMVMGHSAGAYNAAMLALDPRWLPPARWA